MCIRDRFSDDLKKLDDDRVYLKLQGHWIIEMSEMLATSSAKSIEEIRSFITVSYTHLIQHRFFAEKG